MKNNWLETLHKALINEDDDLFKKIPHTDLHCHGITSAPFKAFKKLFPEIKTPPKHFKDLNDFNSFLKYNIAPLVKNLDTVRYLVRETFQRLINEGVVYTEMSFDLTVPEYIGISLAEYLEMISEEKERVAHKLKVCVEAGLDHEINPQRLLKLFKESLKNNIFGSIDLYGNGKSNSFENYIEIYRLANAHNLKLKAHVGETGTADNIKKAIQKLGLQAVQHGISAVQNKEVIKLLIKNNICLNICPISNIALGIIKDITQHPIKRLFNEGVCITVNSDDFCIFDKSVREELLDLYNNKLFSEKEIAEIINNGLKQR